MNFADHEKVGGLLALLRQADRNVAAFEQYEGETVPSTAYLPMNRAGFGRGGCVDLLPILKSVAVSAASRERDKIAAELRALGVTLDPATD